MESTIKRKINIFGKVMKIITTVIIVLLLVAEGFLLTGGIIVAAVPKDSITLDVNASADVRINTNYFGMDGGQFYVNTGGGKLTLGDFTTGEMEMKEQDGVFSLNGEFKDIRFDLNSALLLIVYGMVDLAAIVVALFFFKALMKEFMTCDSPFSEGVVKKMRNFAITLIPCVVVIQGMKATITGIVGDSFTLNFDIISVAFVFIIFMLTMIFKYGTELQKEHDETV